MPDQPRIDALRSLYSELRQAAAQAGLDPFEHGPDLFARKPRMVVGPRIYVEIDYVFYTGERLQEARLEIASRARRAIPTFEERRREICQALGPCLLWRPGRSPDRLMIAFPVPQREIRNPGERSRLVDDLLSAMRTLQPVLDPVIELAAFAHSLKKHAR